MKKEKTKKRANFSEKDFVDSLWKTMKGQEKKNPKLSRVHEKLSPEYEKVTALITKLLQAGQEQEEKLMDEILSYGKKAALPLIDFVKDLKKLK
ncbi:MAG: hypothetical protein Q7S00_06360 [bacterium]|nr:hypothetical protein [bacterium]